MRLFRRTRYFIVFYSYITDKRTGYGNATVVSDRYINRDGAVRSVSKILAGAGEVIKPHDIVLTNIIELNKKDYERYNE